MKDSVKLLFCTGVCLILTLSLLSIDDKKESENNLVYNTGNTHTESVSEANTPVSSENSGTEKYILMYDSDKDSVLLITKKEDGTEIITPVDSINPYYLTSEDINTLTQGIELISRKDMFVLIEDLSS